MILEFISNLIASFGFFIFGFIMSVAILFILTMVLMLIHKLSKRPAPTPQQILTILIRIFKTSLINGGIYALVMFSILSLVSSNSLTETKTYLLLLQLSAALLPTTGVLISFIIFFIKEFFPKD